ncbi:MAG: malate dehydrogenase (oxaloacetate-decarboxylating) [Methanosaeta sp. ASP1-1]|nr:MAG: malate dehydrogenase (oxaloacetate-decarboxylating) [Methanosaeta sp. ASP1-1]
MNSRGMVSAEIVRSATPAYLTVRLTHALYLLLLSLAGHSGVVMSLRDEALEFHRASGGKIAIHSKVPCATVKDLSLAYTPGVAEPCREIEKRPDDVYQYTAKGNLVAVVTDGTAVLGLGDIGPLASIPVMEGKAILFKNFAGIDAFPIAVSSKDPSVIVDTVAAIEPVFGGVNLEDISAPRCFEVEERLKKKLNIPVFHDDQHGTAVVALAALINALKVVGKSFPEIRVAVSGAGAAGIAVTRFLYSFGAKDVILCDSRGVIHQGRTDLNAAGIVSQEMVESMADDAIVFAMANPDPEIMPHLALRAGARVVATGRSDFPNQVNNVLGFPGIFRGALDVRAKDINEPMKVAASRAIAALVDPVSEESIIPSPLDRRVVPAVAEAVARAAIESGTARLRLDPAEVGRRAEAMVRALSGEGC